MSDFPQVAGPTGATGATGAAGAAGAAGGSSLPPTVMATLLPYHCNNTAASMGANIGYYHKMYVPKTGNLRDFTVFPAATDGTGFINGAIYDEAGSTRHWLSSPAHTVNNTALTLGDPNLAVTAGDVLWFGISHNLGQDMYGLSASPPAILKTLPTSFYGSTIYLLGQKAAHYPLPSTITPSGFSTYGDQIKLIMARIS